MISGPPGNLFSILTNVVFTSSFVYLCYSMCIFSHCVYKKSAKIINFLKTQKNPKKPNKTQKKPNPYPRKGQTGIGFFWVTPPPRLQNSQQNCEQGHVPRLSTMIYVCGMLTNFNDAYIAEIRGELRKLTPL